MGTKKYIWVICLFGILITSGCLEEIVKTNKANVILIDYPYKSGWDLNRGYYLEVTFKVRNDGSDTANNVWIKLYVEDQDKEKEFDNSFFMTTSLSPGETAERTTIIDYEGSDTLLKAYITIIWDGGSNKYYVDWTVG